MRDLIHQMLSATLLLTRLPLPRIDRPAGAEAAWAWPLVGVVVGALAAALAWALTAAGLPAPLVAGLVLGCQALLTGALHEDGLADCADGFFGGWTVERRLEIMKDSQIGSYGTLALVTVTLLRWSALSLLVTAPLTLIAVAALSRAPMAVVAAWLPHARAGGLSASVGRPSWAVAGAGVALAVGVALPFAGLMALPAAVVALLAAGAAGLVARKKISGQTGDVLGATQVLAEVAVLCLLVAAP